MSDDLVRRLRAIEVQPIDQFGRWLTNIHAEAAAEIERLRMAEVERAAAEAQSAAAVAELHHAADHLGTVRHDLADALARIATLEAALHASASPGHKCSDCSIDSEPCPDCYAIWWQKRHPNVVRHTAAALADAPDAGPDDNERAERIAYCIARGIDPFEIVADGGCEAWMAVTEHNLRAAAAALADAPGEKL